MSTIRIYGMAPNIALAPYHVPADTEVWCSNDPIRCYRQYRRDTREQYTRWFNLHSRRHMLKTYPDGYEWFTKQTKPIVLQEVQPDIPASVAFPLEKVLNLAGHRYFTFTATLLMALAEYEKHERVELYGFVIGSRKRAYSWERPCFWYWVKRLRERGIEVTVPEEVGGGEHEAGDPASYKGVLYGYETT